MCAGSAAYLPKRLEQLPAERQLHQLRITGMHPHQPGGHRGQQGADQAPQVRALPRPGGPGDQQVRAVQPDRERSPSSHRPTGSARRSGTGGIGRAGITAARASRRTNSSTTLPGPGGTDPAGVRAEPVRQFLGPVGEQLRRLPRHQPHRHQVRVRSRPGPCRAPAGSPGPGTWGRARRWSAPPASAAGNVHHQRHRHRAGTVTSRVNQPGHTIRTMPSTPRALVTAAMTPGHPA